MEAKQTRIGRLLAAVLGVLALLIGYGLMSGAVTPAHAADPSSYGNIDTSATGSIVIHKGQEQGTTTAGTADGTAPAGFKGLAGVKFTAYPITDLPLGTASSWDTLNSLTSDTAVTAAACTQAAAGSFTWGTQTFNVGTGVVSAATDGDGLTTISGGVAAYLVCETESPNTVVAAAQPFVVTIPYPNNGSWLYNVNVYPKNGVQTVTKSISQQANLGLGATASFPVTSTVPGLAENTTFSYYWVQDVLDSRLGSVGVSSVTLDGTALVEGTDYKVDVNGQYVVVEFTSTGLGKLAAAPGKSVVTTFTGKVNSLGGDGVINNTAYVATETIPGTTPPTTPPTPPTTPPTTPPGTPSNTVTTNWGDLKISKVDAGGDGTTGLAGATFEVYAAETAYPAAGASACTNTPTGSAISVNGATTFTSAADGSIDIAGLFVSDSVNATKDSAFRCYVVKEVQAPAGYVTPSGASANTAVAVKTGVTNGFDVTISNTKQAIPGLPLTGAQAQVVLIMLGAALLLTAAGIVLVNRRRRAQRSV